MNWRSRSPISPDLGWFFRLRVSLLIQVKGRAFDPPPYRRSLQITSLTVVAPLVTVTVFGEA